MLAKYVVRRVLLVIPTVFAISILAFLIIQAPPGDFLTAYVAELRAMGDLVLPEQIEALRVRYGLDRPIHVQYLKWMGGILRGDLGRSLQWQRPVAELIKNRLPWSITISMVSFLFAYLVAIPIGIIAATHQYSVADYVVTFIGFIGIAIPNFLFALILLWFYFLATGNVGIGLFSTEYQMAPWSLAKLWDLIKHLWMPALIVGTAGTCYLIRIMRASLLDELQKPYVMVARAKGLKEGQVLYGYPFRIAINPIVSTVGYTLPALINGELLTSLVLGLPTIAPLFLDSLLNQDMFLAGSIVFILSVLTTLGTLVSDILLVWLDPRMKDAV